MPRGRKPGSRNVPGAPVTLSGAPLTKHGAPSRHAEKRGSQGLRANADYYLIERPTQARRWHVMRLDILTGDVTLLSRHVAHVQAETARLRAIMAEPDRKPSVKALGKVRKYQRAPR